MTSTNARHGHRALFVTTRWSIVLSARKKDSPECGAALESLCRAYWYPLYAYVRRQNHPPEDAKDLTQEFFARLLQKDYLQAAAREKGRFRTFLIVALKRFLANEWDRSRAQKRGGGKIHLPLDTSTAETRYQIEPAAEPDKTYERRWALTLLEQTMAHLRQEYVEARKQAEFNEMKSFLPAERGGIPYAELAAKLQMNSGAARVAVHRLRQRFRELFRDEIAHTVSSPDEIDEEVRYLLSVLS